MTALTSTASTWPIQPIDLPYRIMNWHSPEGVVIEIKAVVVGAYRPVQRRAGR